jgi:predicted phosphodiesterase
MSNKKIMRHIIVTDIHGCYDELMKLLDLVKYSPSQDKLISCGDLVEKGPHSDRVVDFFRLTPNTLSVKGNHEEGLIRYWKHEKKKRSNPQYRNPMKTYEDRISCLKTISDEGMEYLDSLPWFLRFSVSQKKYVVVHGGILPGVEVEDMDPNMICRLRYIRYLGEKWRMLQLGTEVSSDSFWADVYDGEEFVFFGHQPWDQDGPKRFKNALGIDLAGVYGNKHCAYIVEEGRYNRYVCVDSKRYCEPYSH